jgi:NAD(P)-dependent dehydrogenase (short-subunit alcohol dehydrogenase family)
MGALEEQVAVVMSAAEGAGAAIAAAYRWEGARVLAGGPPEATGRIGIERVIDEAVHEHGRVDVVVLGTAGPAGSGPVATMSDDDWAREIDLGLNRVFWGVRRALHHMVPRRSGRIVVTSTVEAKLPRAGATGYVAAMHAVAGLVKSVAREAGTDGVAVNAILAGPLNGPAHELSKLGRPNTLDELARVAVLLASPRVTSITGCMFPVDGGAMPY